MVKMETRVIDAYVYRKTSEGIKYLILKRAKTKIYEHLWQGVAGKIEKGEKAWEAAIRELKEETNLTPVMMFIADHISSFYEKHGDRINFVPVFGVEVDSGDVLISNEHCEFKWVEFETALSHLVWNGQKKGINVINEMIISNDDRMKWSRIDLSNLVF
jgi:dATP pyrophosphohydrolase|tara:strand:- start:242 stop:718 length:477 start_codon:yes stop_codon:yes gene_type:complete